MSQAGFFDFEERCEQVGRIKSPLRRLNQVVDWQQFRPILQRLRQKERKNNSGRKAYDTLLMFKILIVQSLYNLSDDETEYQILDRHSFSEFVGLRASDTVPDAKTLWLFREQLKELELLDKLFARFDRTLQAEGYCARKGSIVDATIVEVPRQHNTSAENEQIKRGEVPASFAKNPNKHRQKDVDARWTKKRDVSYYGYKNHVNVDAKHKLIRSYTVTDASVHDSRVIEELLDPTNTNADVYGDSAYHSAAIGARLEELNYRDRTHQRNYRNRPLTDRQQQSNTKKSRIRALVEHVFGRTLQLCKITTMRLIGLTRATTAIGLRNLVYNLDRYAYWVGRDRRRRLSG